LLVPLYGFLKNDTLGLIVLIHDHQKVCELAICLQQAASPRVPVTTGAAVYFNGKRLDPQASVREAGLQALDRVEVVPERADGA
jgi:hypothetical protein